MTYLDCSAYDCCHNKGGACCLGCIDVRHAGENSALCSSYCANEAYANAATDNVPGSAETDVRCNDAACRHLRGAVCRAARVHIDERDAGPACLTRSEAE